MTTIHFNQNFFNDNLNKVLENVSIPPDKSISHRCVIFASLAKGKSLIHNILKSEDVFCTIDAFKSIGVDFNWTDHGDLEVTSVGANDFNKLLDNKIYLGNSGTSCRLLSGVFSGISGHHVFTGDASLSKRTMKRVIDPLQSMGASIEGTKKDNSEDYTLPISIQGVKRLNSVNYVLEIPSAQVKSALLLASLWSEQPIHITETTITRDHTENMMKFLGLNLSLNNQIITLDASVNELVPFEYNVPKDFSSLSFFLIFAILKTECEVTFTNILLNSSRTGLLDALKILGANIDICNVKTISYETVGDIVVSKSELRGAVIPADLSSRMIDEFPILFALASLIKGDTVFYNFAELKHKESDRLNLMITNLRKLGVKITLNDVSCIITGGIHVHYKKVKMETCLDHRIAMSFVILSAFTDNYVDVDDLSCINTSFPSFLENCKMLGFDFL